MYKKIIVPIAMDQLEHGESVLGIAEKLIDEGGEIILLNVVEDLNAYAQGYMIVDFPLEMIEESRKHAVKTLEALKTKHGINGRVEIRTGGAAGSINALAEEENADLVIIASPPPGADRLFHRVDRQPCRQPLPLRGSRRPVILGIEGSGAGRLRRDPKESRNG